jgi:excisionase family DNA binding protein
MRERLDLPNMSEYVSIKDAAKLLGVSDKRVYAYVEDGRLPAVRAAHVIMIPLKAVKEFKPKISGRPRKNTPLWRTSPPENIQLTTSIYVQIQTNQLKNLQQRLQTIRQAQEHIFPGTVARYIVGSTTCPGTIEILLIWRSTEMPNTAVREQALEEFREALADVLDWDTARYRDGEVWMHA